MPEELGDPEKEMPPMLTLPPFTQSWAAMVSIASYPS